MGRTVLGYDQDNRRVLTIVGYGQPNPQTTATFYDAANNITAVTDPRNITTCYVYDEVNRQTEVDAAVGTPEQRTTTLLYDKAGNLQSETTGISTNSAYAHPVTTSYGYDNLNRRTLVVADYGDMSHFNYRTTTAYDKLGNVTQVTDPLNHILSYAYDALNRRTQVDEVYQGTVLRTSSMSYDAVGNLTETTDTRGYRTGYAYDVFYRQTALTEPSVSRSSASPPRPMTMTITCCRKRAGFPQIRPTQ